MSDELVEVEKFEKLVEKSISGERWTDHDANCYERSRKILIDSLQERDALRKKLEIAMKLLKNLKPVLDKLGYNISDTLAEIEK